MLPEEINRILREANALDKIEPNELVNKICMMMNADAIEQDVERLFKEGE